MSEPQFPSDPTLDALTQAVAEYQATYRHPALPPLVVSGLYGLDPTAPAGPTAVATWPAEWPHSGEPGVYAILMADLRVRYIGKSDVLGKRLSTHFRGGATAPEPRVFDPEAWPKHLRRYLVVIPMSQAFETHSLEAYLIRTLRPPQNFVGREPAPSDQRRLAAAGRSAGRARAMSAARTARCLIAALGLLALATAASAESGVLDTVGDWVPVWRSPELVQEGTDRSRACRAAVSRWRVRSRRRLAEQTVCRPVRSTAWQTGQRRRDPTTGVRTLSGGTLGSGSASDADQAPSVLGRIVARIIRVVRSQGTTWVPAAPSARGLQWRKPQRNLPMARGTARALASP